MNKTEIYNKVITEVLELIAEFDIAEVQASMLVEIIDTNLKPKSAGSTRPEDIDGQTWCRYTGEYYDYSEMVYQNQTQRDLQKHKGYSKDGISRWTKARADLAKWNKELGELGVKAMDGEIDQNDKDRFAELKTKIADFDGNNYEYLAQYA